MERNWFPVKIEETIRCGSSTILAYANSTVPLTRFPIKSSKKETRSDRRFSFCQRLPRMKSGEKKRNTERKRFATEELARSGQSANEVANVGSSVPDKILIQIGRVTPSLPRPSRPWPDAQLPPLFKFHAARTEIRAKSAEFLLDKTPKKFEDEETRRKMGGRGARERRGRSGQRANLTPNPSSIVAHLHSSSEALFSLSLFPPLCHSLSHSDFKVCRTSLPPLAFISRRLALAFRFSV